MTCGSRSRPWARARSTTCRWRRSERGRPHDVLGSLDSRGAWGHDHLRLKRRPADVLRTGPRQMALSFDDGPLWDGLRLEFAIAEAAARPVKLTLTENRSVLLSVRREKGTAF